MSGLKNVNQRHDDALSRIGWAELEQLLVAYYREVGWWVEHAGTGGTGARFDGGVDLRIRRDAECVLVQCKYWNAKQVPHNAVHELLGVMVNEGATGAILVSSGEFTRAAIDAAQRHGHVKLVDGAALRTILGPLPEPSTQAPTPPARSAPAHPPAERSQTNRGLWLIALLCAFAYAFIVRAILERTADTAVESQVETARTSVQPTIVVYAPQPVDVAPEVKPAARPQSEAEIRELQRKADEAIRVIEDSTPEM